MKFFASCTTIEELRKLYRRLAVQYHPDLGGDTETMQQINAEYDKAFEALKNRHNTQATASGSRVINETPGKFRQVIEKIITIPGIEIELCGSWIWISGDTKSCKDQLKAAGCFWANKKKMWYWRAPEDAVHTRSHKTMDDIRSKYGSEIIATHSAEPLPA